MTHYMSCLTNCLITLQKEGRMDILKTLTSNTKRKNEREKYKEKKSKREIQREKMKEKNVKIKNQRKKCKDKKSKKKM